MNEMTRIKARFLQDPLPIRLAGLAASLGRVASSARSPSGSERVQEMLEECQHFIEWTAAELEPEEAAELVNMQVLIALWRSAWETAKEDPVQRVLLSTVARQWSDKALAYSGLLD